MFAQSVQSLALNAGLFHGVRRRLDGRWKGVELILIVDHSPLFILQLVGVWLLVGVELWKPIEHDFWAYDVVRIERF